VPRPGSLRQELAQALNAAYADGLLSEGTLSHRLDELFGSRVVDPVRLIGDLARRGGSHWRTIVVDAWSELTRKVKSVMGLSCDAPLRFLALDWSGGQAELLVGRDPSCDVVLADAQVSRRHARLFFRDGSWVIRDLDSTNGTTVNGVRVGRCALRPGDHLVLGREYLQVD
jgi:hypothetical protein